MANQKQYALGIDLGGTKTLAAVVDITTGEVIASERKRTHAEKGQEYIAQHITHLSTAALESAKLPNDAQIVAVGIGAAGQIDRKHGIVVDAPNLGVKDMPMADILGKQFGKPVAVGNDVEIAALGEYMYGAGRGYSTFVVMFVFITQYQTRRVLCLFLGRRSLPQPTRGTGSCRTKTTLRQKIVFEAAHRLACSPDH
jgi:glucokinase